MLHSKRLGSTIVLDTGRSSSQRQNIRSLTQNHEPVTVKKHLVLPTTKEHAAMYEKAFRSFWGARGRKMGKVHPTPRFRISHHLSYVHEPFSPTSHHAASATSSWLAAIGSVSSVIPKYLYQVEFPAGETAPIPPARRPKPKRTQEDRQRVEAVLKVSIFPLKKYISPEMVDSIRKSPYYVHDKDVIVLRCHQHLTQRRNQQQCIRNVSIFIRNVANEIVYRESKTAADKMVDSEEKESNHSQ